MERLPGKDLEHGCSYWEGLELAGFHEDLGAGWMKCSVVLRVRLTWNSLLVIALWLNLKCAFYRSCDVLPTEIASAVLAASFRLSYTKLVLLQMPLPESVLL